MVYENGSFDALMEIIPTLPKYPWLYGPVFATESVVNNKGRIILDAPGRKNITEDIRYLIGKFQWSEYDVNFLKRTGKYFLISNQYWKEFYWATLMSREALVKMKGLNEKLVVKGWEESDLYSRYIKVGELRFI